MSISIQLQNKKRLDEERKERQKDEDAKTSKPSGKRYCMLDDEEDDYRATDEETACRERKEMERKMNLRDKELKERKRKENELKERRRKEMEEKQKIENLQNNTQIKNEQNSEQSTSSET